LAWTELELQFQAAKAQIESIFGEKLADLAKPLRDLSQAFADMIRTLMHSPAVQRVIKSLAEWIEKLAKQMEQLSEKDIEDFIEKIKGWIPDMEKFKTVMKDFVEILQGAVSVLSFLRFGHPGHEDDPARTGHARGWLGETVDHYRKAFRNLRGGGGDPSHDAAPPTTAPAPSTPSAPSGGVFGAPPTATPGKMSLGGEAVTDAFRRFGGAGTGFGGAGPMQQTAPGAGGFGWAQSVGVPAPGFGAGTFLPSAVAASSKMVPKGPPPGQSFDFDTRQERRMGKQSMRGPLDSSNWQMNRTANLVVRNVPGSNLFLTATGMTG
jgi:hypothetical protein